MMAIDFEDELDASVGLTLRDKFAMAALTALIEPWEIAHNKPEDISGRAYQYADAMMGARK